MLRVIFGFIFIVTSVFSKEEFEFQIQKKDDKHIEILLIKSIEDKIQVYQIQYGDTLSELALKLENNIDTLIELNNIKNKDLIITDRKLKYIKKGGKNGE